MDNLKNGIQMSFKKQYRPFKLKRGAHWKTISPPQKADFLAIMGGYEPLSLN